MKYVHWIALLALGVVAVMSLVDCVARPMPGRGMVFHLFAFLMGTVIWGLLLWKMWSRPKSWGMGVGIFLIAMMGLQTFLWTKAIALPHAERMGIASTLPGFLLNEVPILVGGLCCLVLGLANRERAEK